ncbi:hypothetical protein IU402_08940 [Aerococcaceae bacterium zg-BR9]|uniref:hypothetical protein n=1 Tax=Aerococcaceae bacterium zg-1292 TaxID=2774330 RepID=UPI0040637771|nr:hypothetical protein [Aerococcaceae bacterium zg-BR9]
MKIEFITQTPFGTIISLDDFAPDSKVIGAYITVDGKTLYQIKGIAVELRTEILVNKTDKLIEGQEVKFLQVA